MEAKNTYRDLKNHWEKRAQKIVKLRAEGKSFADIGHRFLISRQRAEQIWKREMEKADDL